MCGYFKMKLPRDRDGRINKRVWKEGAESNAVIIKNRSSVNNEVIFCLTLLYSGTSI